MSLLLERWLLVEFLFTRVASVVAAVLGGVGASSDSLGLQPLIVKVGGLGVP